MSQYRYNVTIHCTLQVADEVLAYLRGTLLPAWKEYPHWHSGTLLKVYAPHPDEMVAYALQFDADNIEALASFDEQQDPLLRQLMEAYPQRVMPFSVVMELL